MFVRDMVSNTLKRTDAATKPPVDPCTHRWQKAVAELQQRYMEQRSELAEREGRLKAMR